MVFDTCRSQILQYMFPARLSTQENINKHCAHKLSLLCLTLKFELVQLCNITITS